MKTGDAHAVYADGSEYKGSFINSVFNGRGMFLWPVAKTDGNSSNRHQYVGDWVEGKMHGKGEFKHATGGHTLKGYFAKNLYHHTTKGTKYFLNPLDS
jgi:hypothetical protein